MLETRLAAGRFSADNAAKLVELDLLGNIVEHEDPERSL
jgi:hypothetical protein